MSDKLHKFYTSKAWRELAYNLKIARVGSVRELEKYLQNYLNSLLTIK